MNSPAIDFGQCTIERIDPNDEELIGLVAGWYLDEWNVPMERTAVRLKNFKENGFPFHLVLREQGVPIAAAGLYAEVSLHSFYPEYKKVGPWVALLYTVPGKRGCGVGEHMCIHLERMASSLGFDTLYLYTYSAERLYLRLNYQCIERVNYRGYDEVIMKKRISVNDPETIP